MTPIHLAPYEVIISQDHYLNYQQAVEDLKVVYKCYKKDQSHRLEVVNGRLHKQSKADRQAHTIDKASWINEIQRNDVLGLKNRIATINRVHAQMEACQKEPQAGSYLLAANMYNTSLKVMREWNKIWDSPEWHIQSPYTVKDTDPLQPLQINEKPLTEGEKALINYFELLAKNPELIGEYNDRTEGVYEIVTDEEKIQEMYQQTYQRLYARLGSHATAAAFSQAGLVFDGPFGWKIVRDNVRSPVGHQHTYQRFLQGKGAVMMPIVVDDQGNEKIVLVLNFRHATRTFEFELPRGGAKTKQDPENPLLEIPETPEETAVREALEETGFRIKEATYLGEVATDPGVMNSVVPIFMGKTVRLEAPKRERTEAIKGVFLFSMEELNKALMKKDAFYEAIINGQNYTGHIIKGVVNIDGKAYNTHCRDGFLNSALLYKQLHEQKRVNEG